MEQNKKAVFYAVLAALCYGVSIPFATLLLRRLTPAFLAALLYLGAAGAMGVIRLLHRQDTEREASLSRGDGGYVAAMILLDIAAPVLLMWGLSLSTPATVSLLNNFEIVATALIAWLVFKEAVGKRIWLALALITAASLVLSVADWSDFSFSAGALLALAACICWGMENNCTRMLSLKNPLQIVWVKGLGSGGGALLLAAVCRGISWQAGAIVGALLLGAVAYGGSVYFYILAQRNLGAARTGAYYALAPFVGVFLSFVLVGQELTRSFVIALILMAAGTYLAVCEKHNHQHTHERLAHCHRHNHQDGHHTHTHSYPVVGEHSHYHVHEPLTHSHEHRPDLHHTHTHVQ